jgi:hypothetical protein
MDYKSQRNITVHAFKMVKTLTDEYLFKELICETVKEMSLSDLEKVFNCVKIDPFSEESEELMSEDPFDTSPLKKLLKSLKMEEVLRYIVSIEV